MTVSNQNYAGGGRISYFWSPDWGDTWYAHPSNPILIPGTHPDGVPSTGFQRTPTLLIDEKYHRYVLAYNAGKDIAEKWRRRTYLATAPRLQDIDFDGIPNNEDSCTDTDDDGFGDPCFNANICDLDCVPEDGSIFPGATEVNDGQDNHCPGEEGHGLIDELTYTLRFDSSDSLSWDAQTGAASYQVVRSATPKFRIDCVLSESAQPTLLITHDPSSGNGDYYLVRALLPYPGSWGIDSAGFERTACP
jgi:hypothetical protein